MTKKKTRAEADFEKLRKKWYKKLKKSGFRDIEVDNNFNYLPGLLRDTRPNQIVNIEQKIDYFRFASQFAEDYDFKNDLEKEIWLCHSEGYTLKEICEELDLKKTKVFIIVKKLKQELRKYIGRMDQQILDEKEISMKFNFD